MPPKLFTCRAGLSLRLSRLRDNLRSLPSSSTMAREQKPVGLQTMLRHDTQPWPWLMGVN